MVWSMMLIIINIIIKKYKYDSFWMHSIYSNLHMFKCMKKKRWINNIYIVMDLLILFTQNMNCYQL